jgi:hypothetical protein
METVAEPLKRDDESLNNIRKLLRPIKYSFVDLFVSLARVFFFWLPGEDAGKGQALMVAHFLGGVILYLLYFILPPNQAFRMFIFFFFVAIIIQQIVFRGCVITKAEQRLTGSDETILDPVIKLSGFEPTRDTRVVCSISVVGTITTTLLINTIIDQFRMFT